MENQQNAAPQPNEKSFMNTNKTVIKGVLIILLSFFLLLAVPFILSLTQERSKNKADVIKEISSKWGSEQMLYGPFVQINYKKQVLDEKNRLIWTLENKLIFPEDLHISGELKSTLKKRNIYQAVLYQADLEISANFEAFNSMLENLKIDPEVVLSTKMIFGVQDDKGLTESLIVKNANQSYELRYDKSISITNTSDYNYRTINFMSFEFDPKSFALSQVAFPIRLKGAEELYFSPTAKNTKVELKSDWKDLKYDGNYLPEQKDSTANNAIATANWNIYQSSPLRGKYWEGDNDFGSYKFGVEFLQMNDNYAKVDRSVKYAILFISLTFITFFFAENRNQLKIHLVHYALVGIALCINFVLLLSISEYLGFNWAYLISATATILLIASFIQGLTKQKQITLTVLIVLSILYSFIYAILQLKEQALLVGSIGLFIILALLMHFSKKINWN